MNNFITGLDIGSQSIKAAVAEIKKGGKLALVRLFKMPSKGIRKGVVDDIADATYAVNNALGEIKKISKSAIKNIFLGVGGVDIKVHSSNGSGAVSRADSEITQDDIDRVVQASRAINLAPNRLVLHHITKEFIVDGVGDIRDPSGMVGNKLEISSLIVDAFSPTVKNLTRCVEVSGGGISGLILGPLADARSVLSKNQKELGVVLIDVGFGKTGMSVYEENKFVHAAIFPVGSGNVTNDLAIGLRSSVEVAETIKLSFGSAKASEVGGREMVELQKIDPRAKGSVTKKFIAEIIEVRLAEILEFVNNELKRIGKAGQLPGGAVLAGGGSKIPNLVDLARHELKLSAQIGVPDVSEIEITNGELTAEIEDPEFSCVLGLLLSGKDRLEEKRTIGLPGKNFIRKILDHFIP